MTDFFTLRYIETYGPSGFGIYVDEVHDPILGPEYESYLRHPVILALMFIMPLYKREPLQGALSLAYFKKDLLFNLTGYQAKGSTGWQLINKLLILPTLVYRLTAIPFHFIKNTIKIFTELLPRIIAVGLLIAADHIENHAGNSHGKYIALIIATLPLRMLAYSFSAIRFLSRALTSPLRGILAGWYIGNALGGAKTMTDLNNPTRFAIHYSSLGMMLGVALGGLSASISITAYVVLLPLVLCIRGMSVSESIVDKIPLPILNVIDKILNPIITILERYLGWQRLIKLFPNGEQALFAELGMLHILKHLGIRAVKKLLSPIVREKLKDSIVNRIEKLTAHSTTLVTNNKVKTAQPLLSTNLRLSLALKPRVAQSAAAEIKPATKRPAKALSFMYTSGMAKTVKSTRHAYCAPAKHRYC